MNMQRMIPVVLGAAIGLTGCGKRSDMTIQNDAVPVVPVETAVSGTAVSSTESDNTTAIDTDTSDWQTTVTIAEQSSVTDITESADSAAETAEPQSNRGNTDNTGDGYKTNSLFGKWETVSFSKESGERVSYDLSNPVHKSYYVGLNLNESGQSSLTVETEDYPAEFTIHNNTLTVDTISLNHPVSMVFTVSPDRNQMTAELMNGRIIVTLKRINRDFTIKDYLTAKPVQDQNVFSALIGEWRYQEQDWEMADIYEDAGYLTVDADGSYIYQPKDGSLRSRGNVSIEYEEHPDNSKIAYYAFTDSESGAFWIGTNSCEPAGKGTFYIGNGGTARLFPQELPFDAVYINYIGMWQCDRYSIQIGEQDTGYLVTIHGADSASEDNEWSYLCSSISDGTGLECTGGGTLTHIITAADGSETRTEVYNDGTAKFSIVSGKLFWQDDKENKGKEMSFEKNG